MKRGEIWLVALDPALGHEQKGHRPVLIVSPEAFNRVTKVPVVLLMRTYADLKTDIVLTDDEKGAFEAVSHLARLGHRMIALVSELPPLPRPPEPRPPPRGCHPLVFGVVMATIQMGLILYFMGRC